MPIIGAVIAALGSKIMGILRLEIFVLFRLPDRVLPGVGVQHAPVMRKTLFELYLKCVRDRVVVVVQRPNGSNIRHGCKVWTPVVWRGTEIGIERLERLILVAKRSQLHSVRAYVAYLQQRI